MNKILIAAVFALVFVSIGTAFAFKPVEDHIACFNNNSTATEVCIDDILLDYEHNERNYKSQIERLQNHNEFVSGLLDYSEQLYHNDTTILKTEVQLWKNKYSYVISQHGNATIQDQIVNLTARIDAVETQTERNESHIYIIQNMLRTVQTDIESCLLYTSPSPRDRQKSRMPSSA